MNRLLATGDSAKNKVNYEIEEEIRMAAEPGMNTVKIERSARKFPNVSCSSV